jgi:acetyl coenzyme A synthetase (ADP forming)-like protein
MLVAMIGTLPLDYPAVWAFDAMLADGGTVHVRPIRPDDAGAHRAFFAKQSRESVYFRFFGAKSEISDREVTRFTTVDYHDRMAFVAFLRDEMVAVGRYDRLANGDEAEVAFAVADGQQKRGLATLLLEYLATYAAGNGITRFAADTLIDNRSMLEVFHAAGFRRQSRSIDAGVVHLAFDIEPTGDSFAASERRAWTAGVHSISRILQPASVAVIGAGRNPEGIGHTVVRNLIDGGFNGVVYPVNPHVDTLLGLACSPDVEAIDGPVDLAVLAIPADLCLAAVDACGRKGVKSLVVISSGFAEVGPEGATLQAELLLRAHRGGMRVVGPNCFGVINTAPNVRLNATFASNAPVHGGIAFASQSGALGIAVLEQSLTTGLGLSSFVSMGNKSDVSSNDLLRFWQQDGETRAILLYLESFGNPRAFARVAPVVSRTTPIVVVKAGRSSAGTRAAASHTAALASPDVVVDALFRQAGVIRVDTLEELLDCGQLLANQPALAGNRLAIIGNAGGAAVLAADACEAAGLSVPEFGVETQSAIRAIAGPNAGVSNPVDLGAGARPKLFEGALRAALASPSIDGAVVILAPAATADAEEVARAIAGIAAGARPIVFVHLGIDGTPAALRREQGSIPSYAFPERAVRALGRVAEHSAWTRRPVGQPAHLEGLDADAAHAIVKDYLAGHPDGGWLSPDAAVAMVRAFGIATAAERAIVQPMVRGVELIAGVVSDPMFGPVVMFGSGGTAVELFGDRALRILPLTDLDAHEMVRSIRGAPLLFGHRGAPACDVAAVEDVLLRVARLADEVPQVAEMDLNPLIASPTGAVAIDVRIRLVPWSRQAEKDVRRLR